MLLLLLSIVFFFFNDTATTEIYTLSLHDALPILVKPGWFSRFGEARNGRRNRDLYRSRTTVEADRKSTRLNSSHSQISYAVFCLKKKKHHTQPARLMTRNTHPQLIPTRTHLLLSC